METNFKTSINGAKIITGSEGGWAPTTFVNQHSSQLQLHSKYFFLCPQISVVCQTSSKRHLLSTDRVSQTATVKLPRTRDHIVPSPGDRSTTQFTHPRLSDHGGYRKIQARARGTGSFTARTCLLEMSVVTPMKSHQHGCLNKT